MKPLDHLKITVNWTKESNTDSAMVKISGTALDKIEKIKERLINKKGIVVDDLIEYFGTLAIRFVQIFLPSIRESGLFDDEFHD